MKRTAGMIALVLALGTSCGSGTRVEVANEYGVPITAVSVSFGDLSTSWDLIESGEAAAARITVPEAGVVVISYTCDGTPMVDSLVMPESASAAKSISIYLADGSTTLRYSF